MPSLFVIIEGEEYAVTFQNGGVAINGQLVVHEVTRTGENTYSLLVDGKSYRAVIQPTSEGYELLVNGDRVEAAVETERVRLLKLYGHTRSSMHVRTDIVAPMPALVVKIEVDVGDEVRPGQGLIVLEAMKMENEIRAHAPGKVKEIAVTTGKAVEKGELLLRLA